MNVLSVSRKGEGHLENTGSSPSPISFLLKPCLRRWHDLYFITVQQLLNWLPFMCQALITQRWMRFLEFQSINSEISCTSYREDRYATGNSIIFIFCFLGLHLRHMEVPRLGFESELQLPAYAIATAAWDLSHICNLHHSSWKFWILNPLGKVRDWTCIIMDTSQICSNWAMTGTPRLVFKTI